MNTFSIVERWPIFTQLYSIIWAFNVAAAFISQKNKFIEGVNGTPHLVDASEELKGNHEFVLEVVGQNGAELQYALNGLRGDREVVLAAVGQNGAALQYALNGLRGDCEAVLAAVAQDGSALQYASDELKEIEILF